MRTENGRGVMEAMPSPRSGQAALRAEVLGRLREALARWPSARVFLLYSPGLDDPLGLRDPAASPEDDLAPAGASVPRIHARTVARIPWGRLSRAHQSRVIELDCRQVAAYLLETHPGIDDPLLEESLTLAGTYLEGQREGESGEPRGRHVAGWLVSTDVAASIAHRFAGADIALRTRAEGYGVAWHDPRVLAGIWPGLSPAQRLNLLGEHTQWVAVDALGQIVKWAVGGAPSDALADAAADGTGGTATPRAHMRDAPVVLSLIDAWRELAAERGLSLPADAQQRLHRHVAQARQVGLDGEDLRVYALWATRLQPGFEAEPAVREALAEAARNPDTLAQQLPAVLAGPLLARYALHDVV